MHPKSNDFKKEALSKLKGNYGSAFCIMLIWILITIGIQLLSRYFFGAIIEQLSFLISWPLLIGLILFFLHLSRSEKNGINILFSMFTSPSKFFKSIAISFLITLGTIIGFILLIIPGIWFVYAFSQSMNILADDSEIGIFEAMKKSVRIMKGEKWNFFKLQISFIGWWILTCVG